MPFSFPASPSVGDTSTQNGRTYSWSGYAWEIVATPAALPASVITSGTLDIARIPTGTSSSTVCVGNDSRLSDTRTPTDGSVTTAKLADDAVTYAKIQNVSATDRLLGRSSSGAGDVEEITCTSFARTLLDDADAAAARTTLSVQPTASPAFTGAATFANTGNVVPLTVTNTGTANSFVVNDASGDTTPFVITSSGSVGVGTSSPGALFEVNGGSGAATCIVKGESGQNAFLSVIGNGNAFLSTSLDIVQQSDNVATIIQRANAALSFWTNNTTRLTISSTGTATFAGQILADDLTTSNSVVYGFDGDTNTGVGRGGADILTFVTNGTERVRIGSGGRVQFFAADEKFGVQLNKGATGNGPFIGSDGADILTISTAGGAERVRVDASGNVGIGTTSAQVRLHCSTASDGAQAVFSGAQSANEQTILFRNPFFTNNSSAGLAAIGWIDTGSSGGILTLKTTTNGGGASGTPTERLRVDASGNVLVGQSTTADPAGANTNGIALAPDYISVSRSSFECLRLNLKAADGTIVALFQDAALEGSISVAGNTVSYNAFCGSHWAQLSDQSRPAILRGTVMETIDEMCDWPEDGGSSDRLVRVKVSDTPASRRVYGVFLGWDGQYASTGDMYVAGLGAYMVRVSGVVQSGDLLESAGDGTARTQADDIVRSTTIGKVSSTHRIAEYDDGSYLVPCVLMCG